MKQSTIILVLSLLISGCVTRRACEHKFPPIEKDSIRESIQTVITYRDTTIYITLPGDTVFKESPLLPGKVSSLSTGLAASEAWISDGRLKHKLTQKDTVMPAIIKDGVKATKVISEKEKIVYRIKKVNELSRWQWLQVWAGRVLIGILIIYLLKLLNLKFRI